MFIIDRFSALIVLATAVFFVLTISYSFSFMKGKSRLCEYYSCIVLTAITAVGAALSNNLIVLMVFWGFLGLLLFLLINMGDADSARAAKKSLIVVGGSDALMILGIAILYYMTGTVQMDKMKIPLSFVRYPLSAAAYLCIATACFAKAGLMPFHGWIPDCAKSAPTPVTAYLPASLDKLLGIYLLARLSLNIFVMNTAMNTVLMLVGAFTIIAAVMLALIQHDMKRLLGYHAVSQAGYMVLGIGTGNPIGIAGGLFHMLNHAIYKSCLFFNAGNVEYRAKTCELDRLGALAKSMPVTYISFLIASLSISGIPPFNGFVSKWLIYQGIIQNVSGQQSPVTSSVAAICLVIAMFGSGLTLASFMKLLHAVFLGQGRGDLETNKIKEVPWTMRIPVIVLAGICILFGVFAFIVPLKYFIFPVVSAYAPVAKSSLSGFWSPGLATIVLTIGLILGCLIFKLGGISKSIRRDIPYVGSEIPALSEESRVTGTEFYNSVKEISILSRFYKRAEAGALDIYEQGKKIFSVSGILQYLHNGVLPTYLVWMLLGMVGLFLVLIR